MALGALIGGSGTGLVAAAVVWTAGQPFWLALAVYALAGAGATLGLALFFCRAPRPDRPLPSPAQG